MINKETEAAILRLHHVEKWPVGTIAAQLGVHHGVVRRVLAAEGVPAEAVGRRPSRSDPYVPFIQETLARYPKLRASRLYEMVRQRGYPGRPDHFRAVVRRYRPTPPAEAFLRLRTLPGEQAQVDWGHFGKIDVGRARRPLVAFVMVLSWSRQVFLRFFLDQRMPSFLAGHAAAFAFFGGVPRILLYDNLKSAVLERRDDAIRFHPTLLAFAGHHRFEPRPVAPYRGNEKGRVERAIRYIRDSFFPARTWTDLDDLNTQALSWCQGLSAERRCPEDRSQSVAEAFAQEAPRLLPLPDDDFPVHDRVVVSVGKTPYARFDGNDYSVPHTQVRRELVVLATQDRVRLLDGNDLVAAHARSWDRGQQVEDPRHVAELVARKRAAARARATDRLLHAVPESQHLLHRVAERGGSLGGTVSGLVRLLDAHGAAAVQAAIREALDRDAPHLHAVRQVLDRVRQQRDQPPALPVPLPDDPRVRGLVVTPHALSTYDHLTRENTDDHQEG